jgi:hypothetical protein
MDNLLDSLTALKKEILTAHAEIQDAETGRAKMQELTVENGRLRDRVAKLQRALFTVISSKVNPMSRKGAGRWLKVLETDYGILLKRS